MNGRKALTFCSETKRNLVEILFSLEKGSVALLTSNYQSFHKTTILFCSDEMSVVINKDIYNISETLMEGIFPLMELTENVTVKALGQGHTITEAEVPLFFMLSQMQLLYIHNLTVYPLKLSLCHL